MIQGLILAHLGQSQYSVQLTYDRAHSQKIINDYQQTLADNEAALGEAQGEIAEQQTIIQEQTDLIQTKQTTLTAEQSKLEEDQDKNLIANLKKEISDHQNNVKTAAQKIQQLTFLINILKSTILSLQKKITFVESNQGPENVTVNIWSNIYDTQLSGVVDVVCLGGDTQKSVIIADGEPLPASSDGRMVNGSLNMPAGNFYFNWAMLPGWLKWRQRFGYAEITSTGASASALINPLSHPFNRAGLLMPYDVGFLSQSTEHAYQNGDQALIEYKPQIQSGAVFRGWYQNPRQKQSYLLVLYSRHLNEGRVYNMTTGEYEGAYPGKTEQQVAEILNLETSITPKVSYIAYQHYFMRYLERDLDNSQVRGNIWYEGEDTGQSKTINYQPINHPNGNLRIPVNGGDDVFDYIQNFESGFKWIEVFSTFSSDDLESTVNSQDILIFDNNMDLHYQVFAGQYAGVIDQGLYKKVTEE